MAHLRLRDFRNYARLDVQLSPGLHLLLGDNAQGKTSILEAVYLLATLRSFRGVGGAQMVRHGQKGYFVSGRIVGPGEAAVKIYWSPGQKQVSLNGQPVRKLSEFWGLLRAVVFCSEDMQLVKGNGRVRRRFLDLLIAQTRPMYLQVLQRYAKAVRSRNMLLRRHAFDERTLESFTREVVQLGGEISRQRAELLPQFAPLAKGAYRRIAGESEELSLEYYSTIRGDFAVQLAQMRDRERSSGMTVVGPHRDDLALSIDGRAAAPFASEGQKRSLAIALKMAQAEYLTGVHGAPPVLLIDDIMGELDMKRRSAFVPLLEGAERAGGQVFMTATEQNWRGGVAGIPQTWRVHEGKLERVNSGRSL